MEETKPWWQSKTIWSGLLTAVSAILTAAHVTPEVLSQYSVDTIVTAGLAIATVIFRAKATQKIDPVTSQSS